MCKELVLAHLPALQGDTPYRAKRARVREQVADAHGIPAQHRASMYAQGPLAQWAARAKARRASARRTSPTAAAAAVATTWAA
eukprot:12451451-Alexandrium_andersonii.AAC.1